jgi:Spy/CpxP family protein refolding chaperone
MVIFGAGVITGGLIVRRAEARQPIRRATSVESRQTTFAVPNVGGVRLELLRRLQRELDLTPQQRVQVDRILRESQERTRELMEPITPRLREEVQKAKANFRAVLNPGQQARFDELLQQQRPRESRREKSDRQPGAAGGGTNHPSKD